MSKPGFLSFSSSELMPQEEVLEVRTAKSELKIGIPKERSFQEKRVPLTPDGVLLLTDNGHEIVIESGAGEGANYSDNDFSEAGAKIVYSPKEVYENDVILKVEPPSLKELDMMKHRQTLISALQLKAQKKEYFKKLMEKLDLNI